VKRATLTLLLFLTVPGLAFASVEASPVVTVPGSVASVTILAQPPATLATDTINQLASAIASATREPSSPVSITGTIPVSVVSVGSAGAGYLDALTTAAILALGVGLTLSLRARLPK
jgi:hypothetical protein